MNKTSVKNVKKKVAIYLPINSLVTGKDNGMVNKAKQ
ncbi:hypothetical protein EZS27_002990 [termite gut metagenome]|uniref:Uncharacterized protein n=1 Tax=termite gut metagenome TaxID=433724 RepID=A0A5J4SWI8_9ZZZZ